MNAEQTKSRAEDPHGIQSRAARYAALGDPARLRIADLLVAGDLSPTELQARLGIPSNLLAHHLGVLESAGLVERARSEADRRRSYVRLRAEGLDGLLPTTTAAARRVVFVCTGNSARSPLAAALWSQWSAVPAVSAGTHPAPRVDPGAVRAARRAGLDLTDAMPRAVADVLGADLVGADDLVVTVCDSAHEELGGRDDLHWSVPDPVRLGTTAAFDDAVDELTRRVRSLVPRVHPR